jgi:acetate---CoA ligase (ADP-forming)
MKPRCPYRSSPRRAFRALARITAYGRALEQARKRAAPRAFEAPPLPALHGTLTEHVSKSYLAACGLKMAKGRLAQSLAEANAIAAEIGFPVALKLQSAALAHKSDAGGVILHIGDTPLLEAAWAQLERVAQARRLSVEGVLVEQMGKHGVETIVGARRDPNWGPVMLVGLGGIWAEALSDVRILPVGLDEAEIVEEIRRLRGAKLLDGMRGRPPADIEALAHAVSLIGSVVAARPEITEIDINPLTVYAAGEGTLALDALIVTA